MPFCLLLLPVGKTQLQQLFKERKRNKKRDRAAIGYALLLACLSAKESIASWMEHRKGKNVPIFEEYPIGGKKSH